MSQLTSAPPEALSLILSGEIPSQGDCELFSEVSMIRGEYVLRSCGHYITTDTGYQTLRDYLCTICELFAGKPVWYRLADFLNCEISTLQGCDADLDELNPNLGARASRRALIYPAALIREVQCVQEVARQHPNLSYYPSFVGDASEANRLLEILRSAGLPGFTSTMVEMPVTIHDLDELYRLGITRHVVGLNDLTSLLLGAHRGSAYHDRLHPCVDAALSNIAKYGNMTVANLVSAEHAAQLISTFGCKAGIHYSDLDSWLYDDLTRRTPIENVSAQHRQIMRNAFSRMPKYDPEKIFY